eukprot:scaffold141695_cov43-Cyclotella_meneghiniana.AAC.1
MGRNNVSLRCRQISHQDCVCLDQYMYLKAAGLFQCLLRSILNDETGLRLEFIDYNHHHKLNFESWAGTISA